MQNYNVIEINGISLTERAVHRLQKLQAGDNEYINELEQLVNDNINFVAKHLNGRTPEDFDDETLQFLISDLAYLRDCIEDFRKPIS